jgi:L-arabinose isomerase
MNGDSFNFSEDFKLIGTPHQTGISEYFTWDYDGERNILISEMQEISIVINPNGKILGSVSVDILEK